jgi:hypothetical protein
MYCATQVIDSLAEGNDINEERALDAKKQYEELHEAVLAAMASERQRLDDAKVLKKQLDDERARVPDTPVHDGDAMTAISVLQEDEEAARAEVALAEEKEQLRQLELVDLQRQRNETIAQLQEIQDQHRQRLIPKMQQLQEVQSQGCPCVLCQWQGHAAHHTFALSSDSPSV